MIEDRKLTDHFTLYELTRTDKPEFQDENRDVNETQIGKLTELAQLLEKVRDLLGTPLKINSGYRCAALNRAIGSSDRSQHMRSEAADFTPGDQDLGTAFRTIWRAVKDHQWNVGQLIYETANRPYGVASWIHISLGTPYRDAVKCRQILRMEDGKYQFVA